MNQRYQVWTREGPRELTVAEWWDFEESLLHRVDGPAQIFPDGTELWYKNGQRHRVDGPAVVYPDGPELWYQNDQRHRVDGPARIYHDGTKLWYQNDQRHRVDGPAQIYPDGTKLWFLNDQELPKDEVELWITENDIDLNRLEDQLMFLTEWRP